jgi:hypothetical protein
MKCLQDIGVNGAVCYESQCVKPELKLGLCEVVPGAAGHHERPTHLALEHAAVMSCDEPSPFHKGL